MVPFRIAGVLCAALFIAAAAARADDGPPRLSLPLDCEIGRTCYIQKYFDQDAGAGYRDYRCGPLTSGKHDGTDIRLLDYTAMETGVSVLAAAEGTVVDTRDGMPDVNVRLVGEDAVTDQGLGNVVVILHGDRWRTVYGHMRRGSIAVKKGDRVQAGQVLGQVGMSGLSEFPHVHFAVWHGPAAVDPFTGERKHNGCGPGEAPLWDAATLARLNYVPSFVMHSGFATRPMVRNAMEYGLYGRDILPRKHGRLYFGVFAAGLYPGDTYAFTLRGPDGTVLREETGDISRLRPIQFFVLEYEVGTPLPAGRYEGSFTMSGKRGESAGVVLERVGSVTLQ
jgi:hypothetical protein